MSGPTKTLQQKSFGEKRDQKVWGTSRTTEGVSTSMKVQQQTKKIFEATVTVLLMVLLLAGAAMAQPLAKPTVPPVHQAALPPAQTVAPGFDDLGFIQYASVDAMCDPAPAQPPLDTTPGAVVGPATPPPPPTPAGCKTSGGWLQINNDIIRIPANTIVFFPNTYQTWEEVFENNPGAVMCSSPGVCSFVPPVAGESGLALSDTVRPAFTFEAHVQGQIVNGTYMAGIVQVSQQSVNGMQGFIESLNYADGSMIINGIRVQINDPVIQLQDMQGNFFNKGRYSIGQTPDPRFTSDQGNTTIRSITGYPMCIPRTAPGTYPTGPGTPGAAPGTADPYFAGSTGLDDPQCPEINRPRDASQQLINIYTMNAPGDPPTLDNLFPQDPYTEVPFEVGDFVTIIGSQFIDAATGQPYVSATEVVANLGVYTFPNVDPAYILIEVLLQGTGGTPDPAFPQEAARRTRVEGFSTDPMRNVDISAVDIDPCGNLTFRLPTWVSNFPVEQGLPLIGKKGRWRFRPNGGTFLPPVQNVAAQVSGARVDVQNNGIVYGYYQLPDLEFIFPEDLVPGNLPPAYNFQDLPFLVNGTGPWPFPGSILDSQLIQLGQKRAEVPQPQPTQNIGQLSPWPDKVAAPPAQACVPGDPTAAHAVASFTASANPIIAGTTITLSAQGSFPLAGPFQWTQVVNAGDPIITIANPTSSTASFIAPAVAAPLNLTLQLTVGQTGVNTPSTATLTIPVNVAPPNTPPAVVASATPNPVIGDGASLVTLAAAGVEPNGGTLTYTWLQTGGAPVALTQEAADGSVQSFIAPDVPPLTAPLVLTFTVTGHSSIAGVPDSAPVTVTVNVNPTVDVITIAHVRYLKKIARLVINASDFTPGVTLTVTLAGPNGESPTINPATGSPYTGVMGPVIPFAQGVFTIRFTNVPPPDLTTVRSSAGGIAVSGVTITR
ncbi:MAG TPA: hypothetical protein VFR84_07120 [Candidatus Angelobacter sp.]|nr:hypothetical protein [Candidatus Angelobacter sp.]